ncbi:MAG TPA: Mu transposase C-terminal domain-containing protein [Bryobacteraceae bacterium]|nr:Mu transposase C-terminal domain-containing protein [Bryobacteraceae bacterium]
MSALALITPDVHPGLPPAPAPAAPAPARGVGWIDIATAAQRLRCVPGHVSRRCRAEWMAAGLAEQRRPATGGKPLWYIREDADPALARIRTVEVLDRTFDLRDLTADQRKLLAGRKAILDNWLTARAGGIKLGFREEQITAQFLQRLELDEGVKVSRKTLFNWLRDYRQDGLAGLLDQRWLQSRKADQETDPFLQELRQQYLTLRRLKKQVCWEIAMLKASEQGWEIHSYRSACRYLDSIPKAVVLKYRFGEEAYVNDAEPYLQGDYSVLTSNEIWNGDHHRMDVWCLHQDKLVRPWLTAWQDLRSRKIVGWYMAAHDPNTESILFALQPAVLEHGVPEKVQVDNGKDYDSFALQGRTKRQRFSGDFDPARLQGVFGALGIDARNVLPYHGQSKPIERFFGTLEDRFGRTFPTYCGQDPAHRPEDLQAKLDAGQAPTLEEFIAAFTAWLEHDYHQKGHTGDAMDGRTPSAVWQAELSVKRTAPADLLEFLMLPRSRPVKVTQNGVTWKHLRYSAPELLKLRGQEVILAYDPRNIARVIVLDLQDRVICAADTTRKIPKNASAQVLRDAIAEKKKDRKALSEYHERRPRMAEDLTDRLIRAAAARNAAAQADAPASPNQPPPSIRPVQTPLADQLPALQRALKPAIAVGAESLSMPDVSMAFGITVASEDATPDIFEQFGRALRDQKGASHE